MGAARCIPADRQAIFLAPQSKWINDRSRLKLAEKSRQIGWSWTSAYACVRRTAAKGAKFDQWVSSRETAKPRDSPAARIRSLRRPAAGSNPRPLRLGPASLSRITVLSGRIRYIRRRAGACPPDCG